jgi:hypothetical protein
VIPENREQEKGKSHRNSKASRHCLVHERLRREDSECIGDGLGATKYICTSVDI